MTVVDRVAIVGGGVMGSGIAQTLAQHGYEVAVRDVDEDVLQTARERVAEGPYGLDRAVERGILSEAERDAAADRIDFTLDLEAALSGADAVVEAVPEDLALKGDVFRELDDLTDDVPLYTNTSGFSIAAVANAVADRSRVAGMHFFNPVPAMDLVEVVETPRTDSDVVDLAVSLAEDAGKEPIVVSDAPGEYGFVANRCFGALRREAERVVEEGVATEAQVDTALEEGYNLPVGPFSMAGIGEEWD